MIKILAPKKKSSTQVTAKKIAEKYKNIARRKRATDQFDDLEPIGYNNDTNINGLATPKKKLGQKLQPNKIVKKCKNLAKKNTRQRDKQIEEDVAFVKQVPVHPKDRLARKVRDQFGDLETIDYNNDTNINDLVPKRTSGTQTAAKKIVNKNKNLSRKKKPYQKLVKK